MSKSTNTITNTKGLGCCYQQTSSFGETSAAGSALLSSLVATSRSSVPSIKPTLTNRVSYHSLSSIFHEIKREKRIMSSSNTATEKQPPSPNSNKKMNKNPLMHLVVGGAAGLVESLVCYLLDTIKTRMQLQRQNTTVEKAVQKMRDSLMEPALRLKHLLQEPMIVRI
jgi:Mitochondrial carrier protein